MSSISPGSNSPYAEEVDPLNEMLTAIELAVEDAIETPGRKITRTEQEKLCYFLIKEFDVPVTYSWYLAGANTKVTGEPSVNESRIESAGGPIGVDRGHSDAVREYRDYLISTEFFDEYRLVNIWYTEQNEFLADFYQACAPEEYRDLYLISTEIRSKLEAIEETITEGTDNYSLSSFTESGPEPLLDEATEETFRLLISDLHIELSEINDLHEIVPAVTMGTDVIEQVLAQLTTTTSLTPDQQELVSEVFQYFYDDVWRYPAFYISTQTAEGPNHHHLTAEHAERFVNFHKELRAQADQLRSRCEANGLYPDTNHHSNRIDSDQMAHLQELSRDIIRAPSTEE
jgi:hypothetical protein